MQRAQRGDEAAFDALYREHVGRVYATCLRLSADRRRAEELTQDVFVRCWEKLSTFRGESRFSTWLYRLAANLALDERRARGREGRLAQAAAEERLSARSQEPPYGERLDLERAVAALPRGARIVVVLHDIEGYRYEEIAEMTGVALGTVKSQIHRGRRLLREMLER
ncbi:MAG: RNA polymerase sigma factor [Gemmatimonadota bacterium]